MPGPTLYLIDAYAAFFRCYHAIRTVMNSPVTKEPTNMTFGFVGMLLKLLRAEGTNMQATGGKPDYIAVALDVGGDRGTFRTQIYADYKATRSAPPEDLQPQVERCLTMLAALGIPVIGVPGFEADDVLATICDRFQSEHPDVRIRIVSKDKDLKQLLDGDRVMLFDVHTDTPFSQENLKMEAGITPAQMIDMLALMGDASDNVPGVEGVGEKTAAKLIKEFGSLDAIIAAPDKIKSKIGEKVVRAVADGTLNLARTLVTLRRDVPCALTLEQAKVSSFDLNALIPVLKELGFNRYQDDVRGLLAVHGVHSLRSGAKPNEANIQFMQPAGEGLERIAKGEAGKDLRTAARGKKSTAAEPMLGGLFGAIESDTAGDAGGASTGRAMIAPESGEYVSITTREALDKLGVELTTAQCVAVDTETTALSPHTAKLCGISISTAPGAGYYIPIMSPTPHLHLDQATVLAGLKGVLENGEIAKCGHNLKFDINILRSCGVMLSGLTHPGGCDSMVASYLLDAGRSSHSLDALSLALLGRTNISLSQLVGSGKDMARFDTVPMEQATQYAAEDADVALRLRAVMMPQLESTQAISLFREVEMPLVEVLAEMEWNGITVEGDELERQRKRLAGMIQVILKEIQTQSRETLGRTFDPDSTKQLAGALFNSPNEELAGLGIKPLKRTKTGFSTDAEVLEELAEDDSLTTTIPKLVLEYRQLTKLVSTYLVALKEAIHPVTGRIHTSFNQTVAATGRLASSDPNLQNIPIRTDVGREIRRAFVAADGCMLVTADYSQIELRLLAHLSRDPALIEAFMRDEDIHTAVAAQIHGVELGSVTREQRNGAKMVNFGIVYGITAFGLARRLKISKDQAGIIIDGYKRRFPGISTFLQECIAQSKERGYVQTMLGRRRPIMDTHSNNPSRRALAERLAINSVVQGSAADLIKVAMVRLHRLIKGAGPGDTLHGTKMLLQIHDELVFESPAEKAPDVMNLVKREMERAVELSVPLKADAHIGKNWFEGK